MTLLYIILAIVLAFFLAGFQYVFKRKKKSKLNYLLFFLRFLSLFAVFFLIINPLIEKKNIEIEKPSLLVAIDNSSSIKYNRLDKETLEIKNNLKGDNALNDKFNVSFYNFGEAVKTLDTMTFSESQTSISEPINEFSKIYKSRENPVIIVTDGNQTTGFNIEYLKSKNPIYPVILGDTTVVEDLSISQLNSNKYTFINNQFPVELFVNYQGQKDVSRILSVFHKGRKVFSKELQFSNSKNTQTVSFYLTGNEKGTQFYSIQVEPLENEKNRLNNKRTFSIQVVEEQSKILVLTNKLHPDLGMLKKSIESNKQRSVTLEMVNNIKSNILDYQLVILYQPDNKFKAVFDQVLSKKVNYLIVEGISTDWVFLNNAQNLFKKEIVEATENFLPVFNTTYTPFIGSDIGFSSFTPLETNFGNVTFSIPYQTLLYKKIGAIETDQPLLATFENNGQKGAVLFGENSWRWRMNSFIESKSFEKFDGFIASIIQYLSSSFKNNRLSTTVNSLFYSNESVRFLTSYLDRNLNIDTRAKIWLTVVNKDLNYVSKQPLSLVDNGFIAELENLEEGEYTYFVSVDESSEKNTGKFKVLPFEIEQQFSQSNDVQLKKLASKTGGVIFYGNDSNGLIENLLADNRYRSIQKSTILKTPLIEWEWILGLIIVLLSVEWFVRKYYGKI